MVRVISAAILAIIAVSTVSFAQYNPADPLVKARLVSDRTSIEPGETFYIGLFQDIPEGWHTYWRNAGDAGEGSELILDLPEGWKAGEMIWPAPETYPLGPLTNYVYTDDVTLPVSITPPDRLNAGPIVINALATWQVCDDVCIPEQAELSLTLKTDSSMMDIAGAGLIETALKAAPANLGEALTAGIAQDQGQIIMTFSSEVLDQAASAFKVYPYLSGIIDHAAEQIVQLDGSDARVDVKAGYLTRQSIKEPAELLISFNDEAGQRHAYEVTADPDVFVNTLVASDTPGLNLSSNDATAGDAASIGWLQAALFALLGGLILNLMPCVFPILSMKALTLVEKRGAERSEARLQGLIFAVGVIGTFLALGGLLLILRVAGLPSLWGVQLQVPGVVISLIVLMVLIGFNFLGMFEIGTSLQNVGSGVKDNGRRGAFLTGVLAVFVAAPCLAPFMTGALAFALAQPPLASLSVFAFLGLGLALPFVVVSFSPALLSLLPKPGAWMVRFRQFLAFPMFATAIWLIWVLVVQVGSNGVIWALLACLGVGFTVWAFSIPSLWARLTGFAGLVLTLGVIVTTARLEPMSMDNPNSGDWAGWSQEAVEVARAENRPVFVDFTAAWCVTCQVNKLGALSDQKVKTAFKTTDIVLLRADYTNRSPIITAELERHNSPGVPLYLVYPADGGDPEILPTLLKPSIIIQSVNQAAN